MCLKFSYRTLLCILRKRYFNSGYKKRNIIIVNNKKELCKMLSTVPFCIIQYYNIKLNNSIMLSPATISPIIQRVILLNKVLAYLPITFLDEVKYI